MGIEVNENFLVRFIVNSLSSQYASFQMGYNNIKDRCNVHELHNMLIQEETRLKKQGICSINLMGLHKVNVLSAQIHKKDHKNGKCYLCKKLGHYHKDSLKCKAWFEKKGKPSAFICFESNLIEIPYDLNHKSKFKICLHRESS
ncbi:hypothetical protein AAG906_025306 [Vitis piasezkii]